MDVWAHEFRGQLGIALTDIITMGAFLRDLDVYFAKPFDGRRHDSGDPRIWVEKLIAHYQRLNIDPRTKWAVFSDALNIPKALALCAEFEGQIMTSFGIGTDLTNDLGVPALSQVVKMTICNGQPTAKISDSPGKGMCEDAGYMAYLRQVFAVKEKEPLPPEPSAEVPRNAAEFETLDTMMMICIPPDAGPILRRKLWNFDESNAHRFRRPLPC